MASPVSSMSLHPCALTLTILTLQVSLLGWLQSRTGADCLAIIGLAAILGLPLVVLTALQQRFCVCLVAAPFNRQALLKQPWLASKFGRRDPCTPATTAAQASTSARTWRGA